MVSILVLSDLSSLNRAVLSVVKYIMSCHKCSTKLKFMNYVSCTMISKL